MGGGISSLLCSSDMLNENSEGYKKLLHVAQEEDSILKKKGTIPSPRKANFMPAVKKHLGPFYAKVLTNTPPPNKIVENINVEPIHEELDDYDSDLDNLEGDISDSDSENNPLFICDSNSNSNSNFHSGFLNNLPKHLKLKVLWYLDEQSLWTVIMVSKSWYRDVIYLISSYSEQSPNESEKEEEQSKTPLTEDMLEQTEVEENNLDLEKISS